MKKTNLIGVKFGDLIIKKEVSKPDNLKRTGFYWLAECVCGKEIVGITQSFVHEGRTHCGCKKHIHLSVSHKGNGIIDMIGRRFGNIIVLRKDGVDINNKLKYRCLCDCGKEFTTLGSSLRRKIDSIRFCVECGRKEASKKITGKYHYLWNPKLSHKERELRRRPDDGESSQEIWRTLVFKRDNYICCVCNKRGGELNAHHLNNYKEFVESRFDVNNGVTLCYEHHKEFHKMYGSRGSTKKKFYSFIENKRNFKCQK